MLISFALFLTFFVGSLAEIFVDYSDISNEGTLLSKFFYGVQDGFFVDVGAYDPYFHSNTVNLEAMGWDGINVDAGPNRLMRFFFTKPFENNLNAAIGLENEFSILYDLQDDSSSTISKNVLDYNLESMKLIQQYFIPSLTFKQFCQRYYLRRPLFMSLDIEGFGYKALQSNDWTNPKCVPDIIFSQNNIVTQRSGFPEQQKILIPNGYIKWRDRLGMNEAFIHSSVYDHYMRKYEEGAKRFQRINVVRFDTDIQKANFLKQNLWSHYQITTDKYFYHIVRNDQIVDIQKIYEYNNFISENQKNRPILLMNYDPNKSFIALRKGYTYTLSETPTMNNAFFNLTIKMENGDQLSLLIYDHKHRIKPRLLILIQEKQMIEELRKQIERKKYAQRMGQSLGLLDQKLNILFSRNKELRKVYQEVEQKIVLVQKYAEHQNILQQVEDKLRKQIKKQIFILASLFVGLAVLNFCLCKLKQAPFQKYVEVQGKAQSNSQLDDLSASEG